MEFLFCIFIYLNVYPKNGDNMLEDLKVLNGELSPRYDKYNNKYTIKISKDVSKVDFNFIKEDNIDVSIYGNNNLKEGDNNIVLLVKDKDNINYIYITVIKEKSKEIINVLDNTSSLEIANSTPIYTGPLIATSCFLIIIVVFLLLFYKKRSH